MLEKRWFSSFNFNFNSDDAFLNKITLFPGAMNSASNAKNCLMARAVPP